MGISAKTKEKFFSFTAEQKDRLIRMGWEDRTTFDAIQKQFQLTPNEFTLFMRTELDRKTFNRWRRRVHEQGHLKNAKTRVAKTTRFKCSRQSLEGRTKGWK